VRQWQSRFDYLSRLVSLAHFSAEAGKVYFFQTRIVKAGPQIFLDLDPIDSDEGKLLIASYPMSIPPARK
jgi:hypothetical protein